MKATLFFKRARLKFIEKNMMYTLTHTYTFCECTFIIHSIVPLFTNAMVN